MDGTTNDNGTAQQVPKQLLPIDISLDHNEQVALIHVLNSVLRSNGIEAMSVVGHFINKLEGAQKIAQVAKNTITPVEKTKKKDKK